MFQGAGLVWLGRYCHGQVTGTCWKSVLGSAWLVGEPLSCGKMTGHSIAFIYPDLKTAIVGHFTDGKLQVGFHSRVVSAWEEDWILHLQYKRVSNIEFR